MIPGHSGPFPAALAGHRGRKHDCSLASEKNPLACRSVLGGL